MQSHVARKNIYDKVAMSALDLMAEVLKRIDHVVFNLFVECNITSRNNFAGPKDFRDMSVEYNILPHVNGSSRLTIADTINILCSVKVSKLYMD